MRFFYQMQEDVIFEKNKECKALLARKRWAGYELGVFGLNWLNMVVLSLLISIFKGECMIIREHFYTQEIYIKSYFLMNKVVNKDASG